METNLFDSETRNRLIIQNSRTIHLTPPTKDIHKAIVLMEYHNIQQYYNYLYIHLNRIC